MKEKLTAYFEKFRPLAADEKAAILDDMVVQTFKKGTVLLHENQVSTECYFVLEGCVRQYYMVEGQEKTTGFFTEDQWVLSIESFTQKTPAGHYFICLEDSTLVIGTEKKENDLYRKFPAFETLSRMVLEKVISEQQTLLVSYVTDSPEQRYLKILKSRPQLLNRIPQYQLASYLGVTPESLSRIRKRITVNGHLAK